MTPPHRSVLDIGFGGDIAKLKGSFEVVVLTAILFAALSLRAAAAKTAKKPAAADAAKRKD